MQDSVTHHTVVPKVMELLGMGVTLWLVVGVVTLLLWLTSRRPRGLPPGPALCLPVVGHLPLMRGDPRHVLMAMRKQYGDVFHLYLGSRLVVVLCGYEAMREALVKNADVFSDRPSMFIFDVLFENKGVVSTSGQQWKEQRKFALTALREFGFGKNILQEKILEEVAAFTETIAQEKGKVGVETAAVLTLHLQLSRLTERFLGEVWGTICRRLGLMDMYPFNFSYTTSSQIHRERIAMALSDGELQKSFDIKLLLQTSISNIICSIVFGKRFDYGDPTFISFVEDLDKFEASVGNTGVVNFFPLLKYVPGDPGGIQETKAGIQRIKKVLLKPSVEEHMKNFDPTRPCEDFIDAYIREMKKQEKTGAMTTIDKSNLLGTTLDLFAGGTDSTATILHWSLVYLLNFPQLQERLHEEIQDKIGMRPPRVEDRAAMPLVNAFMQEVLRHTSIGPLGVAHSVSQDTVFRGYRLPKGTMVIPFLESALKDPAVWRDPDDFRPDRFLQDGKLVTVEELVPFSLGRRVCLGEPLARMEFFLFLASMVQHFRFVCPEDSSPPPLEGRLKIIHYPHLFKLRALPRL